MKTRDVSAFCILWILTCASQATGGDGGAFDSRIAPILARRCLDCHSGSDPKGKLDLSTRSAAMRGGKGGPAIIAGKPDDSPVWERIAADEMPPDAPLPEAERLALRDWIGRGAVWGSDPIDPYQVTTPRRAGRDWWSLQPVAPPPPGSGVWEGLGPVID